MIVAIVKIPKQIIISLLIKMFTNFKGVLSCKKNLTMSFKTPDVILN